MPNIDELFKRRDCDREIIILCLVCVGIAESNSAAMINETCYYTNPLDCRHVAAPRTNDMLHRVTFAAVWESPQESGSRAVGSLHEAAASSVFCVSASFELALIDGSLRRPA